MIDDDLQLKWMYLDDDGIVTTLPPITSLADFHKAQRELGSVFFHANHALCPESDKLYFRGDDCGRPLGDNRRTSTNSLRRTFEEYRRCNNSRGETEWQTYIRMRHAGVLNTALLDWTASPEIALWFAIHEADGSIKDLNSGVLWVYRYIDEDERFPNNEEAPIPPNGTTRSVVCLSYWEVARSYYENDISWGERPTMQKAAAVRLKFADANDKGEQYLLPMDKDPYFRGRLIRIGIEGNYEFINAELNLWLEKEVLGRERLFSQYLALNNRQDESDYKIARELNDTYRKELSK